VIGDREPEKWFGIVARWRGDRRYFFDCFNTLIDEVEPSGLCGIPRMSVELGFFEDEEDFYRHYVPVCRRPDGRETHLPERLRLCLAKSQRKPDVPAEDAISRMLDAWLGEYPQTVRAAAGAKQMLDHWHGHKRLGVVSNFFLPDWPQRCLRTNGLDGYFEFIINSADLGYRKPYRGVYEHAMSRIGKEAAEARSILFIGDRVDLDIDPPRAMGMRVLHYKNPPPGTKMVHETPEGVECITHWDQFR
jgi:putative hydrolase of the HAD superfamily